MKYDLSQLQAKLKHRLSSKRYEHTLGVQYMCAALAMKYNYNIRKAQIAGLLHDCAKYLTDERILEICTQADIIISPVEKRNPFLLHSKLGAHFANIKYGISDTEIIEAITYHTTGRPNMNVLEKIVYVADFIEPNRKTIPNLDQIRKLAFEDLDMATFKVLENSCNYLKSNSSDMDPLTEETYIYYKNILMDELAK